jgi:hypothetical protein
MRKNGFVGWKICVNFRQLIIIVNRFFVINIGIAKFIEMIIIGNIIIRLVVMMYGWVKIRDMI